MESGKCGNWAEGLSQILQHVSSPVGFAQGNNAIIEAIMYRVHEGQIQKLGGCDLSQQGKKRHEPRHLALTGSSREHLGKAGRRIK